MLDGVMTMGENTAGYYDKPPAGDEHLYRQDENGKWVFAGALPEGVGDVNSDAKGSGARYNSGKPPMHYIPFRQQLILFDRYLDNRRDIRLVMQKLAEFEAGGDSAIWDILMHLVELSDIHDATYVWDYGAKKYAAFNWAKGMAWSIPLACISRHIQAIIVHGEEFDEESGCKHWGHVVCNLLMLEHYSVFYREGDDRPPASVFERD